MPHCPWGVEGIDGISQPWRMQESVPEASPTNGPSARRRPKGTGNVRGEDSRDSCAPAMMPQGHDEGR
jgi:hypothetical protein